MKAQAITTHTQFGAFVRDKRKQLGITQAQLGEKIGLRPSTISDLERGENSARIDTILRILSALSLELVLQDRSPAVQIEDIF